jgi:tetratricopeptide (TPR) repeat protein
MMKVLNYLLQEIDATEDDFAVALSVALSEGEIARALSWAEAGIAKFPDSHKIRPLYIQILRLSGQLDNASALIQNTDRTLFEQNPNYLLEKAIIAYDQNDFETAKEDFEELLSYSEWPDIIEEAQAYLTRIGNL